MRETQTEPSPNKNKAQGAACLARRLKSVVSGRSTNEYSSDCPYANTTSPNSAMMAWRKVPRTKKAGEGAGQHESGSRRRRAREGLLRGGGGGGTPLP